MVAAAMTRSVAPPAVAHPVPAPARRGLLLLAALYVAVAAALWWLYRPALGLATLVFIVLAWLLPGLRQGRVGAWAAASLALAIIAALQWLGLAGPVLALLPLPISAALAWVFGRTLRAGAEPLVVRFIRVVEGPAQLALPGVRRYAVGVTVFWTMLLGAQAVVWAVLLLAAPDIGVLVRLKWAAPLPLPSGWVNLYLHIGGYAVVALAMIGEYAWRRWHLRHVPQPGPVAFGSALVRRWPQLIRPEPPSP